MRDDSKLILVSWSWSWYEINVYVHFFIKTFDYTNEIKLEFESLKNKLKFIKKGECH